VRLRRCRAIAADAVASTVGNMVADRMQNASIAKTTAPSSTDFLAQQAIAAVNGQVLPGAIGGVGSGFMPLDTSYNGNAGLFGAVGGVTTTLDAVTSAASVDALAASRARYSASSLLFGPSMGFSDRERPIMLADAGSSPENTLLAWRVAAGQMASDAGNYVKGLANTPTQFVNGALALGHAAVRGGEAIGLLPPGAGAGPTPQIPYFQTDGGFAARSGNATGFALTMFEQIPAKAVAGVTRLFDATVAGQGGTALGKMTAMSLRSPSELMGVEPASAELLAAVGNKRSLVIAKPGSDELRMLDYFGAEASVGGVNNSSILPRENPSKAAVLEEFLHETQARLGIVDRLGTSGLGSVETHVKDFMMRHQQMLGLSAEDVRILQILRDKGL